MKEAIMNRLFACLALVHVVLCKDNWSPEEGNSAFEPSSTVLEQWSAMIERTEKVMKKPDRYIVNRPTKGPNQYQQSNDKEVSETDLFLLGAIEKLAHKMEILEKRLSRTEEMLYQLISGGQLTEKQEPCPEQFQRFGDICYHVSSKQMNWKSASSMCRSLGSALFEFETADEEKALISSLQHDSGFRGKDFWTGGLNPGLLWIWSNSAKPLVTNSTQPGNQGIEGEGRCLLLKYQALERVYAYRGTDCSSRNYYICRYLENSVDRALQKLQKQLRFSNDPARD